MAVTTDPFTTKTGQTTDPKWDPNCPGCLSGVDPGWDPNCPGCLSGIDPGWDPHCPGCLSGIGPVGPDEPVKYEPVSAA